MNPGSIVPDAHPIAPAPDVPNNAACPLLLYSRVFDPDSLDLASAFEALFARNGWSQSWRNGIFDFHHYHSTAHEVLGVYSGSASVQFGGEQGPVFDLRAGDVVIVPAGVAHRRHSTRGRLGVVGAYPDQQHPDMCHVGSGTPDDDARTVAGVARPPADPVAGRSGGLAVLWRGES